MKKKILLISFILSLPFWLWINNFAESLEDFYFPEILSAEINQAILQKNLKTERLRTQALQELQIEAKAAISVKVNNKGDERILFEKNSQKPLPIASLTKLMTGLVVFDLDETYNFSQLISITKQAVGQEGGSKYGDLIIGENISVENLVYIMLIESSNDAAFALTQPIGEKAFVDLMNLYAKDIGLKNTYFNNPTGLEPDELNEPKNISTARDIVKLTKYILKNYPQIFKITTNQSYEVLKPDGTSHHFIPQNTNELLGEVEGIIGGKTGWAPAAGGCLLLVLDDPDTDSYFINIVLGAHDRFAEMRKLINAIR